MEKKLRSELNRLEKEDFDLHKIKELLQQKPMSSKELMEKLGLSSSVLKHRLDKLMGDGVVECYEDPADRRRRFYRIANMEKVKASMAKYSLIQFLQGLKEPQLLEKRERVDGIDVTVTVLFEGKEKLPTKKIDLSDVFTVAKRLSILPADKALLALTVDKSSFS